MEVALALVALGTGYALAVGLTAAVMDPIPYDRSVAEHIRHCDVRELSQLAIGFLASVLWPITWAAFLTVGLFWLLGFVSFSTVQTGVAVVERTARELVEWRGGSETSTGGRLSLARGRK